MSNYSTQILKLFAAFLFISALALSCTNPTSIPQTQNFGTGILVVNQGNYTYGNASVTFWDFNSGLIEDQIFAQINGFKLGDIAQSAIVNNSVIYVVVNNSGKILAFDKNSFQFIGAITDLVSPRYMLVLDDSTAIVSDLYSTKMPIIDLKTLTVKNTIDLGVTTENMLKIGNFVLALNWCYGNKLLRIDLTDWSVKTLDVIYEPNSLVLDKYNRLWVLSDGGLWQGADSLVRPGLTLVDPFKFVILKTLRFDSVNISPSHLCINSGADTMFFLISAWTETENSNYGVYAMSVDDTILPQKPLIAQSHYTFYSLNFLPQKNWLAICDAADFTSKGNVLFYTTDGKFVTKITAGIIPGFVLYKN